MQEQSSRMAVAGSSSHSFVDGDGNVKTIHDTFTGIGKDGVFDGTRQTFHNVYPLVGSLGFDMIAILTIALLSIAIIKWKTRMSKTKLTLPAREKPAEIEMVTLTGPETV